MWGDQVYFSHGTHHSAGVAFLFNKFTGDILETFGSDDGKWIVIVARLDNSLFLICNTLGYNGIAQAKALSSQLCSKRRNTKMHV